jgi:hypothetical protein
MSLVFSEFLLLFKSGASGEKEGLVCRGAESFDRRFPGSDGRFLGPLGAGKGALSEK